MNELEIYQRIRQNESEFITVQEFETQEEWDQYQSNVQDDVDDIEIIEDPSDQQECTIL